MDTELKQGITLQNGKYTIVRSLGQGSFGITYLATTKLTMQGKLGQMDTTVNVAIKEFFMEETNSRSNDGSSVEGSTGSLFSNYRKKFRKEAENLSRLDHPNIVKVLEVFDENNTTYYVMQYIDGESLDNYILRRNGIPELEAISIIKEVGSAVQYMHANKMLHLDLKPKNVMLDKDGKCYLIDFGLSKQYTERGEPESSTKVGAGTPGYAPIEQANYREGKGFPVTMDVYALGGTLFKMLTGKRSPEASELLNDGFPLFELQEHNVSEALSAFVAKAMAPIKKDRFQSVTGFLHALDSEDETTFVDVKITDKKHGNHQKNKVEGFHILPNTTLVNIEYSPMSPTQDGQYFASVSPYGMRLGRFDGSTYFTFPINEVGFKKFLSDLQNLNVSVIEERLNSEISDNYEKLVISLFDSEYKRYAKYWIGGSKGRFGNIVSDIHELNETIKIITPHLQGFWSSMYDRKKDKTSDNKKDDFRLSQINPPNEPQSEKGKSRSNPSNNTGQVLSEDTEDIGKQGQSLKKWWMGALAVLVVILSWVFINSKTNSDKAKADEKYKMEVIDSLTHNMILVEGGSFIMGKDTGLEWTQKHKVTLSDFYIGVFEVTQSQWKAVMGNNPSVFKGDNLPVENVKWGDVLLFIQRLNAITGKNYRLPTEAEWEYAAKGGKYSKGYRYSGSDNFLDVAWCEQNSKSSTHEVGTKTSNELGLFDMSGNVNEWCSDWYSAYPKEDQTNPQGGAKDHMGRHIIRGGGWNTSGGENYFGLNVTDRTDGGDEHKHHDALGFRLACNAQ